MFYRPNAKKVKLTPKKEIFSCTELLHFLYLKYFPYLINDLLPCFDSIDVNFK